ncbi:MAG: hypothetical protein IIY07_02105 [Thermoguttaceae bacterium]|nr:hypothetical protein [Thermoguttaceae bacterium]
MRCRERSFMISFLKGTIEEISEKSIFLDVNGVGYEVYMPNIE